MKRIFLDWLSDMLYEVVVLSRDYWEGREPGEWVAAGEGRIVRIAYVISRADLCAEFDLLINYSVVTLITSSVLYIVFIISDLHCSLRHS